MSGRKDDLNKIKLSLIPSSFIMGIGQVLTFGAEKYSERNWEEGMDYDRVFSALQRHLWDWWGGEKMDAESGLRHLYHAACCLMFLCTYEKKGMGKDWDRRFVQEKQPDLPLYPKPENESYEDWFTRRHKEEEKEKEKSND